MKQPLLSLILMIGLLAPQAIGTFQTFANFTDRYSAVFKIEDDPDTGAVDAFMKVTLIFKEVPI